MKWQLAPCFFTPLHQEWRWRLEEGNGWFSADRGEAPARFFSTAGILSTPLALERKPCALPGPQNPEASHAVRSRFGRSTRGVSVCQW